MSRFSSNLVDTLVEVSELEDLEDYELAELEADLYDVIEHITAIRRERELEDLAYEKEDEI